MIKQKLLLLNSTTNSITRTKLLNSVTNILYTEKTEKNITYRYAVYSR